jgi:EpsI family protein
LTSPLHQGVQTLRVVTGHSEVAGDRKFGANKYKNGEILFWYDINGRILANGLTAKASTIWDALTRGRTNGALVMVYRDPEPNVTQESSSAELKDFAVEVLPILRNYLP